MNIKMLLKEFEEILSREDRAKHFYEHYIDFVEDKEIRNELISIRNEEIKHIKIAKKLIELVS